VAGGYELEGPPFAFLPINGSGRIKWGKGSDPKIEFSVAEGFYNNVGTAEPFATGLTIFENYPSTETHTFDIEYQFNLLYRVVVKWAVGNDIISDTNWLVVKPRVDENVEYKQKGRHQERVQPSSANHTHLKNTANFVCTTGAHATPSTSLGQTPRGHGDDFHDVWIKAWEGDQNGNSPTAGDMLGGVVLLMEKTYWDGYQMDDASYSGTTCHKWGKHGLFDKPGTAAAFFQKDHENGGKFKREEEA
jgi:hypothetical protein